MREAAPDAGTNLHTSPPSAKYLSQRATASSSNALSGDRMPLPTVAEPAKRKYGKPDLKRSS